MARFVDCVPLWQMIAPSAMWHAFIQTERQNNVCLATFCLKVFVFRSPFRMLLALLGNSQHDKLAVKHAAARPVGAQIDATKAKARNAEEGLKERWEQLPHTKHSRSSPPRQARVWCRPLRRGVNVGIRPGAYRGKLAGDPSRSNGRRVGPPSERGPAEFGFAAQDNSTPDRELRQQTCKRRRRLPSASLKAKRSHS